jgi:hypothetical protein
LAPWRDPFVAGASFAGCRADYRLFVLAFLTLSSGIPMHVVVPSVSRATVPHGTALTVLVETPSWATVSKPGPVVVSGSGPLKIGGGELLDAGA